MAGALARALEMRSTAIHGNESGKRTCEGSARHIDEQYGCINIYFPLDNDTDEEFEDEDDEDWD